MGATESDTPWEVGLREDEIRSQVSIRVMNTSTALKGSLAHHLQCCTAWNTRPPAKFKMADSGHQNGRPGISYKMSSSRKFRDLNVLKIA